MRLKYVESNHGYYLDGKRCRGVSTTAKLLDDTYDLDRWRMRMVAIGVAMDDEAVHLINATSETDKAVLDAEAQAAIDRAGAALAADAGTAVHAAAERHIHGQEHFPRLDAILKAAGLVPSPALTERCIVWPEQKVCGRFDTIALRESDGMSATIDFKTGSSAIRYPHATVVQLALYANAPLLAGEMTEYEEGKFLTDTFTPLPAALDREVGYIVHLPADEDAAVYAVNLKLGLKAANDIIFPALRWRALSHDKLIKRVV